MAILIPPKPGPLASSSVMRMFRMLKSLGDEFTVRHLLDAADGPQFLVVWRDRHAFLIRVAATSQELAETALTPGLLPGEKTFRAEDLDALRAFGPLDPAIPVRCLVVFPNVDDSTIDQIERCYARDSGVDFLGLKQTPPSRFACHLEALAEPPISEPMLLTLREQFDAGSRIRGGLRASMAPLSRRGGDDGLPAAFLDLDQECLAKLDVELPPETARMVSSFETRLVTGPAGSGKSLVLLHRALFAARLNRRSRLLILTHNRPINGELQQRALATAPQGARIEWLTFFAWATRCLPQRPERILGAPEVVARVRRHLHAGLARVPLEYVVEEMGYLRDLGVSSLEEYIALERNGRMMALTAPRREAVWQVLQAYQRELRQSGELDWHEVALRFREVARDEPWRLPKYDFLFIDEAQFFAKVWFEPVMAALRPGGQLFLAADPTQGFLKRRDSWLAAGLEVRGRSSRLSVPYRSTRAILRFARSLINQRMRLHPDLLQDLDPPSDDDIAGAAEDGEVPVLLPAASRQEALSWLVREIRRMHRELPELRGHVLILHSDSRAKADVVAALRACLGVHEVADLNASDPSGGTYCRVSNLKAATGLEAAVVILLGVDDLLGRECDPRLDGPARAELAADHTRLLYMACTRAARRLVIVSNSWGGVPDDGGL